MGSSPKFLFVQHDRPRHGFRSPARLLLLPLPGVQVRWRSLRRTDKLLVVLVRRAVPCRAVPHLERRNPAHLQAAPAGFSPRSWAPASDRERAAERWPGLRELIAYILPGPAGSCDGSRDTRQVVRVDRRSSPRRPYLSAATCGQISYC